MTQPEAAFAAATVSERSGVSPHHDAYVYHRHTRMNCSHYAMIATGHVTHHQTKCIVH